MEPIPKSGLHYPNNIARIYLQAMEEVMGKNGLNAILNMAGLNQLVDNYPPNNLNREFDFADYSALNGDRKQMAETMYQTLLKILALDHRGCQWCALHGLGHLHHPFVRETVQSYLIVHRNELTDEDVKWVEQCRDGSNL